jgi:GNAT superfamily N-acetyltransferase
MKKPARLIQWPEVSPTWNQTAGDKVKSNDFPTTLTSDECAAIEQVESEEPVEEEDAVSIVQANYRDPAHAAALDEVLSAYAEDAMGGGEALKPSVRRNLVSRLGIYSSFVNARPYVQLLFHFVLQTSSPLQASELDKLGDSAVTFLAFVGIEPAGIINGFKGFSTFAAKPLINIHDCAVSPQFRRRGICTLLLDAVEEYARSCGCCKVRNSV